MIDLNKLNNIESLTIEDIRTLKAYLIKIVPELRECSLYIHGSIMFNSKQPSDLDILILGECEINIVDLKNEINNNNNYDDIYSGNLDIAFIKQLPIDDLYKYMPCLNMTTLEYSTIDKYVPLKCLDILRNNLNIKENL